MGSIGVWGRWRGKGLLALLGSGAITICFFLSFEASACSCVPIEDPAAHLADVDVVYFGRVVKTRKGWLKGEFDPVETEFRVTRAYKGVEPGKVKVSHQLDGGLCGLTFTRGDEILVLAHKAKKEITTGLCTMLPVTQDPETYLKLLDQE